MRIVHVDTGMQLRGGQTQLMLLVRGLRARGHEQVIACPGTSQLATSLRAEGFEMLAIERSYGDAVPAIRRLVKSRRAELVAAHDARAQTLCWLATVGLRVVRVADRLVAFEPRNRGVHRLKYTRTCDLVIASSQVVKDTMVRNGVPGERIEVIRGGIEFPSQLPPQAEARARMRAKWKLGAADFVLGHLAAFTEEKGQLDALEAVLALLSRRPEVRLILAGDGPLRESVLLRSREAKGAVLLPGYIQAGADFYAGLDLFLANSTSEALGLSPLYAMAHGVPVIASHVGGLPEVVGDGGWLIPAADRAALRAAIEDVIFHPAERIAAALRAREQARGFSASVTIEATERAYRKLISQ